MSRKILIGTRVRERRLLKGLKQAELANLVGISGSYLNLIEHNRRRIGGKLLADLARTLEVEQSLLSDGVEAGLIADLRDAVEDQPANADRAEELAGRFPRWAKVIVSQKARIAELEQRVAALSDRVSHDPFLSESLHEILSTVTAIHSTASILVDPEQMNATWRKRFSDNLFSDSERLASAGKALAKYLDSDKASDFEAFSPHDELDRAIQSVGGHFEELETGRFGPEGVAKSVLQSVSPSALALGLTYLDRYRKDAQALPMDVLVPLYQRVGCNPARIGEETGVSLPIVLRRLASLPADITGGHVGVITCDGTGTLLHKLPPEGFSVPRVGAACSLWPLFGALLQPLVPLHRVLGASLRAGGSGADGTANLFDAYTICEPIGQPKFNETPTYEATMLLVRRTDGRGVSDVLNVGPACRLCPVTDCAARRERSVLAMGFDSDPLNRV